MEHLKKYWFEYTMLFIALITIGYLYYTRTDNKKPQNNNVNPDDEYMNSPNFKRLVNKLKTIEDDATVKNFIKVVWPAWKKSETTDIIKYRNAFSGSKSELNNTGTANEYELAWNSFLDSLRITCCHTKGGYFYNK